MYLMLFFFVLFILFESNLCVDVLICIQYQSVYIISFFFLSKLNVSWIYFKIVCVYMCMCLQVCSKRM